MFGISPSLSLHEGKELQKLTDESQKKTDDKIQFTSPHLQLIPTVFGVIPSVIAQVVGGRSEHELEASMQ